MLPSTAPRLFRFLLFFLIRIRRAVGRIAHALQAQFASFWRSIQTFARHGGQSHVRLYANDVSAAVDNNHTREPPQISESKVDDESGRTLAALPVRRPARWEDELAKYHDLTSGNQFVFHPCPATPEGSSQRYKPKRASWRRGPSIIPIGQHTFLSALPPLPEDWERHVHPEGVVLFYHRRLRIFTESDLSDQLNCKEILFYATTLIQKAIDTDGVIVDELTEIVLNVDDRRRWHYYFVDHTNCLLFWLHPMNLRRDLGMDLPGITGYDHIRYLVKSRYWYVSFGSPSDMITATGSTNPFMQDELVAILDLINSLKDDEKISDPCSIWVIARLMAFFTEDQFMNFRGQPCARLSADTPLLGRQIRNRSIVFRVFNAILLGSPSEHAARLQRVCVDGTIIQQRWKDFVNRLMTDFGQCTLLSTVMLAVNLSFLTVPGVVIPGPPASPTQIVIYCSVVSTIGSIMFTFILSSMYSDPEFIYAGPVAEVMRTLSQVRWGMACLAITHSLPFAFMMWSVMLFSTALGIQIFGPKELATVTTLGVECFILILFSYMTSIVWRLFYRNDDLVHLDTPEEHEELSPPPTGLQHDVEPGSAKC